MEVTERWFERQSGRFRRNADAERSESDWFWLDLVIDPNEQPEAATERLATFDFDQLAIRDALGPDVDLPKHEDFDDHVLVVLRELAADRVETHEINGFLHGSGLVTIRREASPVLTAIHDLADRGRNFDLGGPDELLATIAESVCRRYLLFERIIDENLEPLTEMALAADPHLLEELTGLRRSVAEVRGLLRPHRDVFDELRQPTPLVTEAGRRRFSDAYDTASRAVHELDGARTAMAEILGAYQGAEARKATEITRVLTVYAAVLLPLALMAAIFGMNVEIPAGDSPRALLYIVGAMLAGAVLSLLVFFRLGWLNSPQRRRPSETAISRSVLEAVRSPTTVDLAERRSNPRRKKLSRRRQ